MPRIPEIIVPTNEDLQPLYDAALRYGKASSAQRRRYGKLSKELGSPDAASKRLRTMPLKRICQQRYDAMEVERKKVNEQFPGLDLSCPAPWVGWEGDMTGYFDYVAAKTEDYVRDQWRTANEEELTALRTKLRKLPRAGDVEVGDILYDTKGSDCFHVVKITHNRKRINTVGEIVKTPHLIRPAELGRYIKINRRMLKELLGWHRSSEETFKRYIPAKAA